MNISERIFDLLKQKNITQKEFSVLSGIPSSTVSDWKKKGNTPKAESLPAICRALGVSVYDLLGEKDDMAIREGNPADLLTDEERFLIEHYRHMDSEEQKRLLAYFEKTMMGADTGEHGTETEVYGLLSDDGLLVKKMLARKLRKLARLDRIRLDENEHSSKLNLHLYKYLDYLGVDKLEYIKMYLSNIQPFMLTEIRAQEKFDNAICVLDKFYRISVYIKVDATAGEEVIVSFHENHKNGIAYRNPYEDPNGYVYVFADSIGSHVVGTDKYSVNLFITRGVKTFPVNVPATRYDDEGFIVRYTYINNALIDIVNDYLGELYTSDLYLSAISYFSSLQQLSFTSYGNDVFSNISLLVDSILIQKDATGRQTSDAALVIYCNSVELTQADKEDLISTLKARFEANSVKAFPQILDRISMNL